MKWAKRRDTLHEAGVSSLKAISQKKDLISKIGSPDRPPRNNTTQISPVPRSSKKLNIWRAESDFQAFWLKFHATQDHLNIDASAKAIVNELEISRVEILGGKEYKGAKKNIAEYYKEFSEDIYDVDENTPLIFNLWLKDIFNEQLTSKSKDLIRDLKKKYESENFNSLKNEFINSLENQRSFTGTSLKLLELLGINQASPSKDDHDESEKSENKSEEEDLENNEEVSDSDDSNIDSSEVVDIEMDMEELNQEEIISSSEGSIDEEIEMGEFNNIDYANSIPAPYKIYSSKFDEIIEAKELISPEEAIRLRSQLDNLIKPHLTTIGKLANRLQRLLLSQQKTNWDFDLEEGTLDTSRLHRVIAEPGYPLSYKQESENNFKDTVITLLIDNSGSMRGRSISLAAICGDIISSTFERCSVKTEVLGFTTKNWKGGDVKQEWLKAGSPSNPGRLNDLRHIIYKSADSSWRRSRKYFGAMLREGLLKENIDGEALLWSYSRLNKRQEERKIIIVISDGAPVDDSTLSANTENYLDSHLKESINFIESSKNIELQAIGIGHDVNKYYKNAITIHRAEELGEVLLEKLTKLFKIDQIV